MSSPLIVASCYSNGSVLVKLLRLFQNFLYQLSPSPLGSSSSLLSDPEYTISETEPAEEL